MISALLPSHSSTYTPKRHALGVPRKFANTRSPRGRLVGRLKVLIYGGFNVPTPNDALLDELESAFLAHVAKRAAQLTSERAFLISVREATGADAALRVYSNTVTSSAVRNAVAQLGALR